MKVLTFILVLIAIAFGGAWYFAGRAELPKIEITKPGKLIGQRGELEVVVETPNGLLERLEVALEQGETRIPVFSLAEAGESLNRDGTRVRVSRSIGKKDLPQIEAGEARIVVEATRPVLFGLRKLSATATHDVSVRLSPPGIAVMSTHHYINHGGSEMVVYRVTPSDVESGVRVGELEYPGFPASGAGIPNADPALRVAFFALMWDQTPNTPIQVFARDEVGNQSIAGFDYRVFPKTFRKSRIPLDDRFFARVVPPILHNTPELKVDDANDMLGTFLRINGDLRRQNAERIASLSRETSPEILWRGPFKQLVNSAVEGGFADQRTYIYNGKDVDFQVHLGYDLASTAAAPVLAANRGKVVFAAWLGIYGNCVILDHGMGLQSLYAHLSSIDVKVGDMVDQSSQLGRSGATGLAGGDHLHFTMLLAGRPVTPIDWWSPQWVQDRITRKLRDAGAEVQSAASTGKAVAAQR